MSNKSSSPAKIVEDYLIYNIWNKRYPVGSTLPSEQRLSEKIGVTRTTLREVLQRLAGDGWLNIRHGKPTVVNNIWDTAGLKLLDTIVAIEQEMLPHLIDNFLGLRKHIEMAIVCRAFKQSPEKTDNLLSNIELLEPLAKNFAEFDFNLLRELAFVSDNSVYGLMINGLHGLYLRFGLLFFSKEDNRQDSLLFYRRLRELGKNKQYAKLKRCINTHTDNLLRYWNTLKYD